MAKSAIHSLIKHALSLGLTVTVGSDGEIDLRKSSNYKEIVEAIKAIEEAELWFYDGEKRRGWALVSFYGLAPDEQVMDTADSVKAPWIDAWWEKEIFVCCTTSSKI
jgi:hypothetical protein